MWNRFFGDTYMTRLVMKQATMRPPLKGATMLKLHATLEKAFPTTYRRESKFISLAEKDYIEHDDATISFKLQEGAINEVGENGVQVIEMLHFIKTYVEVLDKEKQCPYNLTTIHAIHEAINAQNQRTADRINRGVEGTSKD